MRAIRLTTLCKHVIYFLIAVATIFATLAITTDLLGEASWKIVASNFIIIWLCLFLIIFYRPTCPTPVCPALPALGVVTTLMATLMMILGLWCELDNWWYIRSVLFLTLSSGFLVYVVLATSMEPNNKLAWLYRSCLVLCSTLYLKLCLHIAGIEWTATLTLVNAIFLSAATACLIVVSFTKKQSRKDKSTIKSFMVRQISADRYIDDTGRIYAQIGHSTR